jgi:hypothetical protein
MPRTSTLMIAASASKRSVMSIDSSGTHDTLVLRACPRSGQLHPTQTSEPSGTSASG